MTSTPPPAPVHSERYSTSNVVRRKRGVVIHNSESGDGSYFSLRNLVTRPGDRLIEKSNPKRYYGSSYKALTRNDVDKNTYDLILDASQAPFAAPPLNKDWWHICIPGYARQTRFEWLDPESHAGIKAVAKFIRDMAAIDGFDVVRLSTQGLIDARAGKNNGGIVDHWTVSRAFGDTNHTDVGALFPWDVLELEVAALYYTPPPPAVPFPNIPAPTPTPTNPSEEESVFTHLISYKGITYRCFSGGYKTWVQHPDEYELFKGLMAMAGEPVGLVEAQDDAQGFHLMAVEGPVLGPTPPNRDPWGR